jgi:FkbM family methyltransferase
MTIHHAEAHLIGLGQPTPKPVSPSLVKLQKCRHGMMMFFPHDTYIGGSLEKYGEYVKEETDFLLAGTPVGGIVVEVGANIGCHTLPLAQKVGPQGHVLAFEPQRIIHQMLCGNLAINAVWNVSAERAALGNREGIIYVPPMQYAEEGNFGGVELNETSGEPVPLMKLDMYPLPALHLFKIDVEGMELQVLQGAQESIKRFRPLIYVENDRKEKSAELISMLRSLDYDMYWHLPPLFQANNYRECSDDAFPNIVSFNMACIPHERAGEILTNLPKVDA